MKVEEKKEVKREDSTSHLLDLLSDLAMPSEVAADNIKAVNNAAWQATPQQQQQQAWNVRVSVGGIVWYMHSFTFLQFDGLPHLPLNVLR